MRPGPRQARLLGTGLLHGHPGRPRAHQARHGTRHPHHQVGGTTAATYGQWPAPSGGGRCPLAEVAGPATLTGLGWAGPPARLPGAAQPRRRSPGGFVIMRYGGRRHHHASALPAVAAADAAIVGTWKQGSPTGRSPVGGPGPGQPPAAMAVRPAEPRLPADPSSNTRNSSSPTTSTNPKRKSPATPPSPCPTSARCRCRIAAARRCGCTAERAADDSLLRPNRCRRRPAAASPRRWWCPGASVPG